MSNNKTFRARLGEMILDGIGNMKRKDAAAFFVLVLGMVINITHLSDLYHQRHSLPFGFALVAVIILDLVVLVFIYRGRTRTAFVFALLIFILNVAFYKVDEQWLSFAESFAAGDRRAGWAGIRGLVVDVVFSYIPAFTVHAFGKMLSGQTNARTLKREHQALQDAMDKLEDDYRKVCAEVEEQKAAREEQRVALEQELAARQEREAAERKRRDALKCPHCGKQHDKHRSMVAHAAVCEKNPNRKTS